MTAEKKQKINVYPDLALEVSVAGPVVGVDEVGCGPWAGPVVAAAAMWRSWGAAEAFYGHIRDSKMMTARQRRQLREALIVHPDLLIGIAEASVEEIDRINIRQAASLAMVRAVGMLPLQPATVLVDGTASPNFAQDVAVISVIKGDTKSLSIATASILAKEYRDDLMAALGQNYPGYGWERNAGYGTRAHADAIATLGITAHHRQSFAPIARLRSASDGMS